MPSYSSISDFTTSLNSLPPDVDKILTFCTETSCSDLFIKVGEKAQIYRYGIMYTTNAIIDEISWYNFANKAITSELNTAYVREKMVDFSYSINKNGKSYRYRVNAGYSVGKNIATFRMISNNLPSFQSLKIDNNTADLLNEAFSRKQGISLLVGATGSGKTSTLAACINSFSSGYNNRTELPLKDAHMITLEDPIEYIYPSKPSTRITQKELGKDFMSFELGIKSALREHPTHILVGETRDRKTISALVEASRTGHSVISTFHTSSVSDTVSRLYSYLAGENQDVMFDLVTNLNFVMAQKLIKGRKGYTLDTEYMYFVDQIKKILVEAIYKDQNVATVIEKLMKNEQLLKAGLCHGWKSERKR